jgi:hypothetical protein
MFIRFLLFISVIQVFSPSFLSNCSIVSNCILFLFVSPNLGMAQGKRECSAGTHIKRNYKIMKISSEPLLLLQICKCLGPNSYKGFSFY